MRKRKLVCLSGVTGIGKSSVVKILVEECGFRFAVSTTTRPKRPGEQDGVHYHFVNNGQFESMIERDEFLEHVKYLNYYYGTHKNELKTQDEQDLVFDLTYHPALQEKCKEMVWVALQHDDKEEIKRRLKARGDACSAEYMESRMQAVDSYSIKDERYDYLINVTDKTPQQIAKELTELLDDR